MGRTPRSALLLGLLAAGTEAFYFCVPLSAAGRSRTFGDSTSSVSRRALSVTPLALAKRRANGPTLDAGEDFDQLDGVSLRSTGGGVVRGLVFRLRQHPSLFLNFLETAAT